MRLFLVQSRDSGAFLVPDDGYVTWTQSLSHAISRGLCSEELARDLVFGHADDADIVFVRCQEEER